MVPCVQKDLVYAIELKTKINMTVSNTVLGLSNQSAVPENTQGSQCSWYFLILKKLVLPRQQI